MRYQRPYRERGVVGKRTDIGLGTRGTGKVNVSGAHEESRGTFTTVTNDVKQPATLLATVTQYCVSDTLGPESACACQHAKYPSANMQPTAGVDKELGAVHFYGLTAP